MRLTAGLDSGPVCARGRELIGARDTYGSLAPRMAELGAELLLSALATRPEWIEQDDALATYAEKISPQDRWLDPSRPAVELERTVRALTPHVGAFVLLEDGSRLGVHVATVIPAPAGDLHQGVLSLERPRPVLHCAVQALALDVVQPPGRRLMSGEDYLRGLHR